MKRTLCAFYCFCDFAPHFALVCFMTSIVIQTVAAVAADVIGWNKPRQTLGYNCFIKNAGLHQILTAGAIKRPGACKTSAVCVLAIQRTYWFSLTQNHSCLISPQTTETNAPFFSFFCSCCRYWAVTLNRSTHTGTHLWLHPINPQDVASVRWNPFTWRKC